MQNWGVSHPWSCGPAALTPSCLARPRPVPNDLVICLELSFKSQYGKFQISVHTVNESTAVGTAQKRPRPVGKGFCVLMTALACCRSLALPWLLPALHPPNLRQSFAFSFSLVFSRPTGLVWPRNGMSNGCLRFPER